MEFTLHIIIQNTSISHERRQTFNRAPNFVNVPRLCAMQNASNSQAKIHVRASFLQSSFRWLLSNFSYFFKKRKKKQKQFSIPPLCLIRFKSCNCIKIVKIVFIPNFAKTAPIYLQYPSNFVIENTKTTLLAFHVTLTFSFNLLNF